MNKSGVISLTVLLLIIVALLYSPYIEFHHPKDALTRNDQLIDDLTKGVFPFKLVPLTLLFPLLFVLEATFIGELKTLWVRLLYLGQGFIVLASGLYIWLIMSLHLFVRSYDYLLPFYLVIGFLVIFGIWNILLAIPYFDNKPVRETFRKLSLRKGY